MQPRPFLITCLLALLGLSACVETGVVTSPTPVPRPEQTPAQEPRRSAESASMGRHFTTLQNHLVAQGLMRTDGGGPDARFTRQDLVENFIRIALYDEYTFNGGRLVARETPSHLRRWAGPVGFSVAFSDSVPEEQRVRDRASITAYARRLSRVSGHPISTATVPNFHVLVLNEGERRSYAPQLRRLLPDVRESDISAILSMPRTTFCHVFAFSGRDGPYTYYRAVAVIRGEHPNLTRLSCFHEELAQGLGLANDSREARPSIFNDDEEFGLLTRHDELLLRILYDHRLHPGMTEAQARPIVELIARELLGGDG